jgi:hypothetical protein
MLKLGLDLSLSSIKPQGVWSPDDESSLEAWYQKGEGITLAGSDVSTWADSSSNSYDMLQGDAGERPAYSAGVLSFVAANTEHLQTSGADISLTGDFTIGAKIQLAAGIGVLLGDNTTVGEFIRFTSTTNLRARIANTTAVNITKDSGTWLEDAYMVLTRSSDVLTLYWKGVAQADTETKAGTASIDAIGISRPDINPFDGTISEIQIYSSSNATLIANINDRLSAL